MEGRPYFEPFGSVLRDRLEGRERFALLETPAERRLLDAPPYLVVACESG
jgi:hypothetical protein